MIKFFASIFGYVLNAIYFFIKNYGVAIILFSILLKLLLLPLSIKQQKTMKKTQKIQKELKKIQDKYKNDPEKLNNEMMALYKRENVSPFSGCLSSIIQIVFLFAMFYLVRQPLTYMKKINTEDVNRYVGYVKQENGENSVNTAYQEISVIKYVNNIRDGIISKEKVEEIKEENKDNKETVEKDFSNIEDLYINMEFLGLNLSNIPKENYNDWKVFIIPGLYIISSIISIKISTSMTKSMKEENEEKEGEDPTEQMNKGMVWMVPIMSVSVSLIAPLGLALYWLVNNVLMILERIVLNKILLSKEEDKNV